jgi:hypothetical protein
MVKELRVNTDITLRITRQSAPVFEVIRNGTVIWRSTPMSTARVAA